MKTVQEWLRQIDEEKLIRAYFGIHPIDFKMMPDKEFSIAEIRRHGRTKISEFIHTLRNAKIDLSEDGLSYVFFGHKTSEWNERFLDVSMTPIETLSEKEPVCYSWIMTPFAECMGCYVAETEYTMKHIEEVLAEILYELSFFGYTQKQQDAEREILDASIQEAESGMTYSHEEVMEELGIEKDEKDEIENRLQQEICQAETAYSQYILQREIENVRRILEEEKRNL